MAQPKPTKLDEERIQALVASYRDGAKTPIAAMDAGISYTALSTWLKQGNEDIDHGVESLHAELVLRVNKARATLARESLQTIHHARHMDHKASQWILMHCFPKEYGRNVLELVGEDGAPIIIKLAFDEGQRETEDGEK